MSVFCRHNRFTADCPICSKGTVLDPNRAPERRPRRSSAGRARKSDGRRAVPAAGRNAGLARASSPRSGPYEDGREVRLERVPGGLRLAAWHAGQLVKDAPAIDLSDLPGLLAGAVEKELLAPEQAAAGRERRRRSAGCCPGRSAPAPAAPASCATSCASSASTAAGCGSRDGSCGRTAAGSSRRRPCCCRRRASPRRSPLRPGRACSCQTVRRPSDDPGVAL